MSLWMEIPSKTYINYLATVRHVINESKLGLCCSRMYFTCVWSQQLLVALDRFAQKEYPTPCSALPQLNSLIQNSSARPQRAQLRL
jgi:hypothetical protein